MTAIQLAEQLGLKVVVAGEGAERTLSSVYCCDLLSIVMGRAPADGVWVTVMGNINTIAVAVLTDVSCVILSENVQADDNCIQKAKEQGICLLQTELPTFDIALKAHTLLS